LADGRDFSSGRSRRAITTDSAIALVDRATAAELSMRSRVCCKSALEAAATLHSTSPDPVMA
jgi:hypothetical protein